MLIILLFFSTKIKFDTSPFCLTLVRIGILISLEISIGIIVQGIWSKMNYVHQVSFVQNLKGLGAEKQVIDKVAFIVIKAYIIKIIGVVPIFLNHEFNMVDCNLMVYAQRNLPDVAL